MKLISYALIATTIVVSTQILATSHEKRPIATTGDFVALCEMGKDDPMYDAAMGFCLGYIDAVMDYHAAITAGPAHDPIACPNTAVTREELMVIVMEWSKRNVQHLESESPVHGIMRAAVEKWPCSAQ